MKYYSAKIKWLVIGIIIISVLFMLKIGNKEYELEELDKIKIDLLNIGLKEIKKQRCLFVNVS